MATYKVLQDIEAEDTLIGPLTLRQCLYAAIAVIALYLSFIFITKHAAFMVLFMLPFVGFGIFFAFPWSKQQSTEVWALAKVRFFLKPRKRIWNQSGVRELVTITAPKNVKRSYTSNLSPLEVESRLKALADTIDSRGWAIKNVDLGYYTQPSLLYEQGSDRLVSASNLPQEVPNYDAAAAADIFDVQNNPIAQKFDVMMSQSAGVHHQQLMQQMAAPQVGATAGSEPQQATTPQPQAYQPAAPAPNAVANSNHTDLPGDMPAPVAPAVPPQAQQNAAQPTQSLVEPIDYANLRTPTPSLQPQPGTTVAPVAAAAAPQTPVTAGPNPAILELANNNDLNVATIAREAQARNPEPPNEVVVSLH